MIVSKIGYLTNDTYKKNNVSNVQKNKNVQKPVMQNSNLSEIIGRSQVAFKGTYKNKSSEFEYQENYRGVQDTVKFNKDTGCFQFETKKPNYLYSYKFNTATNEETVKEKSGNILAITKNSPEYKKIEKFDDEDIKLYEYYLDKKTGDSVEHVHDTKKNRIITTTISKGVKRVEVFDKIANSFVAQGEAAWVEEIDRKTNTKITRNIVSGIIVKEESLDIRNWFLNEYYEDTGKMSHRIFFDKNKKLINDISYYKNGIISRIKLTDKKGRYEENIERDRGGKEILHTVKNVDRRTNTETLCKFFPGTDKKEEEIINGEYEIQKDFYNFEPNMVEETHIYDSYTNAPIKDVLYHKNSEIPKIEIIYRNNGDKTEYTYFENGYPEEIRNYTLNGYVDFIQTFHENSHAKAQTISIDYNNETKTVTNFDKSGRFPIDKSIYARSGKLISFSQFFENSDIECLNCEYYHTYYVVTEFNENGIIIKQTKYPYKNQNQSKPKKFSEKEKEAILTKVSCAVGSMNSDGLSKIKKEEWQCVLDELGIKDMAELKNMDKKEYRKLLGKFHPDANPNMPESKCNDLFNIIQYFYSKQ